MIKWVCIAQEKHSWDGDAIWTRHFFPWRTSYLKEQLTNYGFPDLDIWQIFFWKEAKQTCHFEESSCQYLLLLIKFELSRKKLDFEKICVVYLEFSNITVLKRLLKILVMILISVTFLILCIMKCVKVWKTWITPWSSIF